VQGQAIGAAAVLADLDEAAQPALLQREFPHLVADGRELGLGGADDVVGGPGLGGPEQVADLAEGESQPPGPADEGQPPPVRLGVLPETRAVPLG
jgi:hypothetical protein